MSRDKIFNSKTDPIPEIRRDIEIIPVKNDGQSYLYFYDSMGYAPPDFALDSNVAAILSLLDGSKSVQDLTPHLGEGVSTDQLLEYIQFLDDHRLLNSSHFKKYAKQIEQDYEDSDTHTPVTAGLSYPDDPQELRAYLDGAFSEETFNGRHDEQKTIKALYAPHIDPRVGMRSYTKAFSAIKNLRPKRVIILATSHYAGFYSDTYQNDPFIVSSKNFKLPLGTIPSDKEAIEKLMSQKEETGLTTRDRAHRIEHSIEIPLLFLNYLWDHEYKIIPILVSGLDDLMYMKDGYRAKQIEAFGKAINEQFQNDDETFFLISGDLAHIGKKFGDRKPAREMFNEVKSFDKLFLQYAERASEEKLLDLISEKYDPYRICGFPPLYTFLKSMPGLKGKAINYDLWDEHERESAVSFGSILYWNTDKANGTGFNR